MSFFSSRRERRLWIWTAVIVAAIYSTLGLARTLDRATWATTSSPSGCSCSAAFWSWLTVITQGLKVRPGGAEIAVALGVAAAYLLVLVRMSVPTERSHLVEYGVVAVFIHEALTERAAIRGRRVPAPALLAIVAASLVGLVDEGIQRADSRAASSTPSTFCSTRWRR